MAASNPSHRQRATLTTVLLLVIALGLGSRGEGLGLPAFVSQHAGDTLWTVAVYLSLALLRPKTLPIVLGAAAISISVVVELSQLIDAPWLHAIRGTLPGRLLLGSGFLWIDLVRYAAGAGAIFLIDWALWHQKKVD